MNDKVEARSYFSLAVFVCISLSAGIIGSLFTAASVTTWYPTLAKPAFTPPSWLFAPVWTTLYILMGISGWLLWRKRRSRPAVAALILFALQLGLNVLWSALFFGLRVIGAAFAGIVALALTLALYSLVAWRASKSASMLFWPYLAWVCFAAVLNAGILLLN